MHSALGQSKCVYDGKAKLKGIKRIVEMNSHKENT